MKTRTLIMIVTFALVLIPVTTKSFAEESFDGYSSIDPPLSEVTAGQSTVMTIKFWYTSGPYAINNFTPIIEVNPSSARPSVQVDVDSIEITQGQIKRIPVTLTADSHIEHEKIFLSISYAGHHSQSGELQKSSWNDQVALDVKGRLVPEPEQDKGTTTNWSCGPGTTLQDGICVVEKSQNMTANSSGIWGPVVEYPAHHTSIENINGTLYYVSESFELNSNLLSISFHNVWFTPPYTTTTLPYTTTPPRYIYSDVIFSDETEETLRVIFTQPDFTEHKKPQAGFVAKSGGYHFLVSVNLEELPPLKQVKSGVPIDEIECKDGLVQGFKKSDNSPVCVTLQTKSKLMERGWAEPLGNIIKQRTVPSELEPERISDSESLRQQEQKKAKLHVKEIVLADTRGTENKINAIKEYRDEFESGYFLEQFIHTFKENYEKDRLMSFIYGEWGYQPTENTSAEVVVYFRSYEDYDHIEKINEWHKPKDSAFFVSPDSEGYFVIDLNGMPPSVGIHETCIIPGEYRVSASNPDDESKVEWGYFTCQRDKLVGEPQPWMDLPE